MKINGIYIIDEPGYILTDKWTSEAMLKLSENQSVISKQLTRIADALEKKECKECCKAAGDAEPCASKVVEEKEAGGFKNIIAEHHEQLIKLGYSAVELLDVETCLNVITCAVYVTHPNHPAMKIHNGSVEIMAGVMPDSRDAVTKERHPHAPCEPPKFLVDKVRQENKIAAEDAKSPHHARTKKALEQSIGMTPDERERVNGKIE